MTVRLAAIREEPLSVDEVIAAVSDPSYGGVAVFMGTVRDNDHDRGVTTLDYSAHPTAESVLRRVADEVAAQWPGVALAALHRVGELRVGEIAVIVGAASAHRRSRRSCSPWSSQTRRPW